nr:MAG TPA: hypothetical protein [Bacteriophage sp.]
MLFIVKSSPKFILESTFPSYCEYTVLFTVVIYFLVGSVFTICPF